MTNSEWSDYLGSLEEALDRDEEALRTGTIREVPSFDPPSDLGPLPTRFAERASQLMRRTNLLATFVQYQLVATDADLRFERRGTKHAGAQALYLDRAV